MLRGDYGSGRWEDTVSSLLRFSDFGRIPSLHSRIPTPQGNNAPHLDGARGYRAFFTWADTVDFRFYLGGYRLFRAFYIGGYSNQRSSVLLTFLRHRAITLHTHWTVPVADDARLRFILLSAFLPERIPSLLYCVLATLGGYRPLRAFTWEDTANFPRFYLGGYRLFPGCSCSFSRSYLGGYRLSHVYFFCLALLCHEAITLPLVDGARGSLLRFISFPRSFLTLEDTVVLSVCDLFWVALVPFLTFRVVFLAFRFRSLQEVSGLRPDNKSLYDFNQFFSPVPTC